MFNLIKQHSDRLLDVRHQPLNHIRPEPRVQHLANARVIRRVQKQQGPREQPLKIRQLTARVLAIIDPGTRALGRKARVAQHQLDIGMAGQQPGAAEEFIAPVDRPGFPQGLVARVGVGQERGVDDGLSQGRERRGQDSTHPSYPFCAAGRSPWAFRPSRSNSRRSRSAWGLLVVSSLSP